MPNVGDIQVWNGTAYVAQQFLQGDLAVGFAAAPGTVYRFDIADGTAPQDLETWFTANLGIQGSNGWSIHKKSKSGTAPHVITWVVGGTATWEIGQDFATNNSGNGGTGNSDFVILYDYTAPKNETQIVSTGGATGGTFILKFEKPNGTVRSTGAIAYNASASAVKSALEGLSNIGSGNVYVIGSNGGPWTVVFVGTLANTNVNQLTFDSTALTGGTGMTVATQTDGGPGADILRVSPGEEGKNTDAQPGFGPKYLMSHEAGSPRTFADFFSCEAGQGLGGISISCFYPAGGSQTAQYLNHIDLVQRNSGLITGINASQRCIINFQGNGTAGLWQMGTDFFNASPPSTDFHFYDGTNSRLRLFLKSANQINPVVAFGTNAPPNAITTHATSADPSMYNKQQVGVYVGYNNLLNDRGLYATQVLDATTDVRYLFLGGGFDDGTGAGTRAAPKFKSTNTATWALMGQDSLFAIQTGAIGSNQTPITGLAMDGSGRVGIGLTSMSAALHLKAAAAAAGSAPLKLTSGPVQATPEQGAVEYDGARLLHTPVTTRRAVALASDNLTATASAANTTTETTVFTGTLAANELAVGKTLSVRILGSYSTANGADTFTARCKIGGSEYAGLTLTSTAKPVVTNALMEIEFVLTCRTTGTNGTVRGHTRAMLDHVDLSKSAQSDATVDSTVAENVTITIQWSAANANDSVSITQGYLTMLN